MEQTTLFGKQKESVELKESYGGFEVISPDSVGYNPKSPQLVRWGKKIVEKYSSYEIAKDEFEKAVRINYEADIIWLKSKFEDSQGYFWLDGVKIHWELESLWCGDMYHLEFNAENKTPTLLTETGFRSDFPSNLDAYDSVKDYIKDCLHYTINCDDKGTENKRLKEYKLEWKDTGYNPSKQFTLTELEGGVK